MEPSREGATANSSSDNFSYIYTYLGYLEAISDLTLDDINVEEAVGFEPKDLLIAYSVLIVITLLGVLGNVFSIIVWSQPQLKSSSAVLLTALAVCDILTLICTNTWQFLATLIMNYRSELFEYIYYNFFPYMVLWMDPFMGISETASAYLTVAITVERYIAVCHPFKYQDLCSYSRACMAAVTIISVSFLYNFYSFWDYEVRPHYNKEKNMTTYGVYLSEFGKKESVMTVIFDNHIYLFLMYVLPLASITLFNVAMYRELRKEKRKRELTDLQKKERRLTLMLVYVVIEFAVCTAMIGFVTFCDLLSISRFGFGFDLFWTVPLMVFSTTFNCSVNFVTYITFGGPFRRTFLEMFCYCRGSDNQKQPRSPRKQETNV